MNAQAQADAIKPATMLTESSRAALTRAIAQVNTLVLGKTYRGPIALS
jgi:hypothetical protein